LAIIIKKGNDERFFLRILFIRAIMIVSIFY